MATINPYDTIYEGYSVLAEKIEFLQSELYDNIEHGEFKNYILQEMENLKKLARYYQQVFAEDIKRESDNNGLSL